MTTQTAVSKFDPQTLAALDEAAKELEAIAGGDTAGLAVAIRQAAAMQALRDLLTEPIMRPIMAMMGNPLGFLADRPTRKHPEPYGWETVRDVVIWTVGRGGRVVGNEFNIVSERGYLTKWFFFRRLDESLGAGNWMLLHAPPQIVRGDDKKPIGAKVETLVRWKVGGDWVETKLVHAVKGDEYASADSYLGKADRKCGAWLLCRVSNRRYEEGDADDAIPTTATEVPGASAEPPKPSRAATTQRPVRPDVLAGDLLKPLLTAYRERHVTDDELTAYLRGIGKLAEGQFVATLDAASARHLIDHADEFAEAILVAKAPSPEPAENQ